MRDVDLDAALRQHSRPVRRLLMVALVGLLVLVTISGVVVMANPGVPAALGEMLHGTPTPTATIGPGGDTAYYENGAPWGKLTVDNRTIPVDNTLKPDFLARGRHTLTYRADPFPALRCTITTPAAPSDTCPIDATFASRDGRPMYGNRVVDLGSTLDRLPAAQRDALVALIRSQVEYTSPATTVRPGEHYAGDIDGGNITLETATQPLTATLQIRVQNTNEGSPNSACTSVCLPPGNYTAGNAPTDTSNLLEVWVHVKTGYHYTAQGGSVVLDYAPTHRYQQASWSPDDLVSVYVGWNGAWQITRPAHDDSAKLPCQSGDGDLFPSAGIFSYTLNATRLAPNPTDGCLLDVHQKSPQPTSGEAVYGPPILFLDRFGVLLAVGDTAHQLLPGLVVASQAEAAEANAIAAQGPLP